MIRLLEDKDIAVVCAIVNDNWRNIYTGYVNEELLNDKGCKAREERLKADFLSGRLRNYVYEEEGRVIALLSIGNTEDADKTGAFEVWRIYITKDYQNKGSGRKLIEFAEK